MEPNWEQDFADELLAQARADGIILFDTSNGCRSAVSGNVPPLTDGQLADWSKLTAIKIAEQLMACAPGKNVVIKKTDARLLLVFCIDATVLSAGRPDWLQLAQFHANKAVTELKARGY
jgi:hypothetical protein